MTGKLMSISAVILVLSVFMACGTAEAKEELKIAYGSLGNEVPVPGREASIGKVYFRLLYDPLVGTSNDGSLSKETGAARDWEMSSDGKTWTFLIRKGIKFHDGTELTAKDAKFSIELLIQPRSVFEFVSELRGTIQSIEVPDPYKLIIHLKRVNLSLPALLSDQMGAGGGMIAPKDYYERVGDDGFIKAPIGSGPCKWIGQSVGSYIKLHTLDKHWRAGVPTKYDYVTFLLIPEEGTRAAMLITGEANVIDISGERVTQLKKAGLNLHAQKDAYVVGLYPHGQWQKNKSGDDHLNDVRVRKALAISIDREEIAKHLFPGIAKPAAYYPVPSMSIKAGADPTRKPYKYDPEEAKRLLREAGYSEAKPLIQPMAVYPRAGLPEGIRMMEVIAGYWDKLGLVKTKITMTEYNAWRVRRQAQDNGGWVSWAHQAQYGFVDPSYCLTHAFHQLHSKDVVTQCKRADVDSILDRGSTALDIKVAREAVKDIVNLSYDEYLMWPVVEVDRLTATTPDIKQWDQGRRIYDQNIEDLIMR